MRWLVVLLVGACGRVGFDAQPAADPDGGAHDGTRLRIVWNTFEDGTRTPGGIFDSERGEPCEVRAWADGALYCTPTARQRALFADAACTDALAGAATCGDTYAFTEELCTRRITHLYAKAAQLAPAAYYYLSMYSPSCTAQPVGAALFATAEVAPAELARVDVTGTSVRAYTTDDGFALPFALRDDEHGRDCLPTADGDGFTCLPAAADDAVYGLDAACATRVTAAPVSCAPPDFVTYPGADCRAHVATVTSTIGGVGGWSLPLCTDAENGPGAEWYLVGDEVTGPSIARAVDPLVPGHRLATISFAPGLRDTVLFDTVLGIECAPGTSGDGVTRCLPAHRAGIVDYAGDSADCTGSPSPLGLVSFGCTDPVPDVETRVAAGPVCGPTRYDLFSVGAPATGYAYFHGDCATLPGFTVGPPIDPSLYATYSTGTDP